MSVSSFVYFNTLVDAEQFANSHSSKFNVQYNANESSQNQHQQQQQQLQLQRKNVSFSDENSNNNNYSSSDLSANSNKSSILKSNSTNIKPNGATESISGYTRVGIDLASGKVGLKTSPSSSPPAKKNKNDAYEILVTHTHTHSRRLLEFIVVFLLLLFFFRSLIILLPNWLKNYTFCAKT